MTVCFSAMLCISSKLINCGSCSRSMKTKENIHAVPPVFDCTVEACVLRNVCIMYQVGSLLLLSTELCRSNEISA